MKKLFVVALIFMALLSTAYHLACNNNKSEPQVINKEDSVKNVIERGEYIANRVAVCIDCHSKRDTSRLHLVKPKLFPER
jgi:cytochrome c553